MLTHRRCQQCGCGELPPPDCFGCSPANEPVTWDMDFPAAMTYDVIDSDMNSYEDDGSPDTCEDVGFVSESYDMTREYPDITDLGSGNVCNREPNKTCAWGFFAGVGYGRWRADGQLEGCSIPCTLSYTQSFYGSASNVTDNWWYATAAPQYTNQSALDTIAASAPADCGDVIGQCGTGFGATYQSRICDTGLKFGYAGLLEYNPVGTLLTFTIKWIPRIQYTSSNGEYQAFQSSGKLGPNHAGLLGVDGVDSAWTNCFGALFPGATSGTDLKSGTFQSNHLQWRYSKVVDCATEFGGSPITLTLIDSTLVLAAHARWSMADTPATITVTPNF